MSRYEWDQTHAGINRLKAAVAATRSSVVTHEMYSRLDSHPAIVTFMEHHVFAVWDFMSLLKSLQRNLTCVEVPWVPTGPSSSRRLINDIVLVEESDELGGGFIRHLGLDVRGISQAGADNAVLEAFLDLIPPGPPV